MQRRRVLGAAAGLGPGSGIAALGTLFGGASLAQGSGPLVLGQSAALSGPAGALGTEFRRGAMLVFDAVNASGGVGGRQIELRSLDDGYEPDRCAANTRKFIAGGVFALFGYVGTPTSLAALPLATAAKLPFIAPFTGAEALRVPFNRYAFHVRASYFDETAGIVKQITSVNIKRVGVFYQNDSYGKAGLEGMTRALAPLKLAPAALGTVERNTVDVQAAVKSILAAQPGAIVMISAYKSCAAFVRAARKAGFGGNFYNVSFVGTQALAKELGRDARGVVVSQVMPFPYTPTTPVAGDYLAAGKAAHGDKFEPNYTSIEGYIGAKVLVSALRRPGATASAEALVGALEAQNNVNLGGYFVDFNAQKHTGSRYVDLTILTADGKVRR